MIKDKKRILILEDDVGVCRLIRHVLEGEGFIINDCASNQKAEEMCLNEAYAIILIDYNVIRGIGWDFVRKINESPEKYFNPKVILMSGTVHPDRDIEPFKNIKYDLFFSKPFNVKDLQNASRQLATDWVNGRPTKFV